MTERHDPDDLADELEELRALAGDLAGSPVEWERPPDDLWARISAEAGVATDSNDVDPLAGVGDPTVSDPIFPETTDSDAGRTDLRSAPASSAPEVIPLRPRRRSLPWIVGAAAAALVLVVGLVGVFAGSDTTPNVIAATSLDRLGPAGSGEAELVEIGGSLVLHVDTADLDPGDGFLEVWMIDPDVSKLVSLGPIRTDGIYDVPDGLDPAEFPIVDVSAEPLDGDPTHSGDSLLRGTLTF